ncbi:hypothetical protein [Acidisphaera sp. S103]|uniref:hypothetical protein n=1 Tax=Acidisphaera sp. S103 TaxID=1747223 RepID=UPI00131EA8DF|nr:hypothetical protein [Acidisphaera sp. S103]
MTQTDQPEAHPTNPLLTLVVTLLAPTFLGVTAGDLTLARMAAIQTINDYRARNHADLIAIAQIIACGLAALGSLSQSMDDDISLSMTLRLRGNAVALNRSAEQNRRVLQQPIRDTPTPYHAETTPEPPAEDDDDQPREFLSPAAAQILAREAETRLLTPPEQTADQALITGDKRHQEMWAIALVNEASEITASLPHLPPAERSAASIRAAALGSTANELLTGASSPPPQQPNPD